MTPPPFFPDYLRPPRPVQRPPRRRLVLLGVVLPVLLLPLGWWRIDAVEVEPCPGLPPLVGKSLQGLTGASALTLDLQWVRQQVEVWPGVAAVAVRLELPGTLQVSARPAEVCGSVAIGRTWHAVAADGSLGLVLADPHRPVLEGFDLRPSRLREGLAVAERVAAATGAAIERVRWIMPDDFAVTLQVIEVAGDDRSVHRVVAHVGHQPTGAEQVWSANLRAGETEPALWTDLRWHDRLVERREE